MLKASNVFQLLGGGMVKIGYIYTLVLQPSLPLPTRERFSVADEKERRRHSVPSFADS